MLIELATVLILGTPSALPLERNYSSYCEASGNVALPCVPVACAPTFCEDWSERGDGSLLCLDSDEVYAPGHFALYDAQEDDPVNGPEISAVVEY